ncbi:MAG: VTT domain-containing protein [Candidatus Diapherotrites archaeon]
MLEGLQVFLEQLIANYGLLGLFIASIIGNATIFLPLPVDLLVFALGALVPNLWTAFVIGVVAGLGAAIGEMSGYMLGLAGISAAEKAKHSEFRLLGDVRERVERWGFPFIALASFIPFPFDLVGVAAGVAKYPVKKFFIATLIGKVPKFVLFAFAGFLGWAAIKSFFALG